jgi:asparagine synthase (glutamine-hydrolysing)
MRSGLYALASLDGAPLAPEDLEAMGLTSRDAMGRDLMLADGFAARAIEPDAGSISVETTARCLGLFFGFLDEEQDLRAVLGADAAASPAMLAASALKRWGREAPRHLLGEWSFLQWDRVSSGLTLLTSEHLRDPTYIAERNGMVALAPNALRLARLPWVEKDLDERAVATVTSRAGLRHAILAGQTMWRGICLQQPGTLTVFASEGRTHASVSEHPPAEPWTGTYDEAVEALQAMGRRIVRQHMSRHRRCAFHLSGGLDSTLLTSWGAFEQGPGREMFCLSSVAPPGSGIADESEWSRAAAEALGVSLQGVWPDAEVNLFRPAAHVFAAFERPPTGAFHVSAALQRAAVAGGASVTLGGENGEMHVSNGFDVPETRSWLRIRGSSIRDMLRRQRRFSGWPASAFHVRFSEEFLRELPPEWRAIWRKGPPPVNPWRNGDPPLGISPILRKMSVVPTVTPDGVRHLLPYRDLRLVRLAARLPVSFLRQQGQTRPLARSMLKGRVPDSVRLRTQGRPFAPDYVSRLKSQAPAAGSRIPLYAAEGVGRWLDLKWLASALERLAAAKGETEYDFYYEVQATALFAEFLLWASNRPNEKQIPAG